MDDERRRRRRGERKGLNTCDASMLLAATTLCPKTQFKQSPSRSARSPGAGRKVRSRPDTPPPSDRLDGVFCNIILTCLQTSEQTGEFK